LLAETAKAYRRVGEIQTQLGQFDKAEAALRRSMKLYHALLGNSAQKLRYAPELAAVYNELGQTPQYLARPRETRKECFEQALAILGDDRSDASCLQRIRALNSLGRTFPSGGRWFSSASPAGQRKPSAKTQSAAEDAQRYHREALALAEELAGRDKTNADYRFLLAQTHRYLGQRLIASGQTEEAGSENQHAVEILERLTADFPSVAQYRAELAEVYAMFVAAAWPPSQSNAARERLTQARKLADDLVAQHPRVPDYLALSARLRAREGMFAAWAGNRSEAIEAYRQSIVSFQELADRYPEMLVFPYMVSMHRHVLGEYLRTVGQLEQSRSELEKSAAGLESLLQTKPDAPAAVRNYLRRVYQTLGKTLDELGDHKGADAIREKARRNP
jgi:tetratricopeptide (TPR) repeat protein